MVSHQEGLVVVEAKQKEEAEDKEGPLLKMGRSLRKISCCNSQKFGHFTEKCRSPKQKRKERRKSEFD